MPASCGESPPTSMPSPTWAPPRTPWSPAGCSPRTRTSVFRHPLIRPRSTAGLAAELRRTVHTAIAAHIDPATDPDRHAQHLAAAAREPDESLAAELEQAAVRAGKRGGYSAESSFLLLAAQLTPVREDRARRMLRAATAAFDAGLPHRAEALLDQARTGLHDHLLAGRGDPARGPPAGAVGPAAGGAGPSGRCGQGVRTVRPGPGPHHAGRGDRGEPGRAAVHDGHVARGDRSARSGDPSRRARVRPRCATCFSTAWHRCSRATTPRRCPSCGEAVTRLAHGEVTQGGRGHVPQLRCRRHQRAVGRRGLRALVPPRRDRGPRARCLDRPPGHDAGAREARDPRRPLRRRRRPLRRDHRDHPGDRRLRAVLRAAPGRPQRVARARGGDAP